LLVAVKEGFWFGALIEVADSFGIEIHRSAQVAAFACGEGGLDEALRLTVTDTGVVAGTGNERLRTGILKQRLLERLWRFLKDLEILPTNNAAERSLRTVVMARKVSQCSKNAVGAQTYMRIKFTVETARLRGQDPVAVLSRLMY